MFLNTPVNAVLCGCAVWSDLSALAGVLMFKEQKKITLKKQKDYLKDYLKDFSTDGNKSDSLECERFVLSPSKFSLLLRRFFFFSFLFLPG